MMYTSAVDTRSNRPRAVVNNPTSLARIYHYETFAGTREPQVVETPKKSSYTPTKKSPHKSPTLSKKMKTAAKAVHRLSTYWDVATHYKVSEYLKGRNIRAAEGLSKFLYFLLSLLLMFSICTILMALMSNDHNNPVSSISSFFSSLLSPSPNTTRFDQLREDAARQYDQITKDHPNSDPAHAHARDAHGHTHDHAIPSSSKIFEEKMERFLRDELTRLEKDMKRLTDDQKKRDENDHKTKITLEDQNRVMQKIMTDTNNALSSAGKTEQLADRTTKELTAQIQGLQAELAKVKSAPSGTATPREILDLTTKIEQLQKQKSEDDAAKHSEITGLQSQIQKLQAELSKVKPVDNSREIEELREKVKKLEQELTEHKKTKPAAQPAPELGVLTEKIAKDVHTLLQADTTGRVDYALLNLGARIIPERTSPSYSRTASGVFGDWWPISTTFKEPSVILTQDVTPGQCWSMKGSFGHATVKLAQPTAIGAVTIDHISRLVSPDITSAPREFSVLGLTDTKDEGTLLGTFTYDASTSDTVQTFEIKDNQTIYPIVTLNILSNHGNENYTCIYRFRVHPRKG